MISELLLHLRAHFLIDRYPSAVQVLVFLEASDVGCFKHLLAVAFEYRELFEDFRLTGFTGHGEIVVQFEVHSSCDDFAFVDVNLSDGRSTILRLTSGLVSFRVLS